MLAPSIVEGANQKPTANGVADLTVRSNAPLDMFKRVLVDGVELTEGGTTVALKAGYLSALATGTHALAIESETGTASTAFTIVEKQAEAGGAPSSPSSVKPAEAPADDSSANKPAIPQTGDDTASLAGITSLATAGIILLVASAVISRH